MEIISYVLEGALAHRTTWETAPTIVPGSAVMSAGGRAA